MIATTKAANAYDVALENFDSAANELDLSSDIREMIKYPERILTVTRAGAHGQRAHSPF